MTPRSLLRVATINFFLGIGLVVGVSLVLAATLVLKIIYGPLLPSTWKWMGTTSSPKVLCIPLSCHEGRIDNYFFFHWISTIQAFLVKASHVHV